MDWLDAFLAENSYWGLFLALLACGFGLPVPEDIILITGGVLAAPSNKRVLITLMVCMVGVLGGDGIVFTLGRRYRNKILRMPPFSWVVRPKRLRQIRRLYRKYGYWAIFISRFLAGLRATSFLMAGISQVPYRVFFLADGLAALLSVPFFIYLGFWFADDIESLFDRIEKVKGWGIWAVVGIILFVVARYVIWPRVKKRLGGPEQDGA